MTVYVSKPVIVADALRRLRAQRTHTQFAGYLCLVQRAAELGRLDDLQPNFATFFKRHFLVSDHPLGAPYIKPFTETQPTPQNLWLNENVAGSYAPSSLRVGKPFRRVVEVEGRRYSLPPDHAQRALEHLLFGQPLEATDLAIFLYRDFGILPHPDISRLVGGFAYEFGYSSQPTDSPGADFRLLYSTDNLSMYAGEWCETFDVELVTAQNRTHLSPTFTASPVRQLTADQLLEVGKPAVSTVSTLPLQKLSVEGLLSFASPTEFEFGRLNVLVGPNGTGKSNLIDCIRILRYAPYDLQDTFSDTGFEDWLCKSGGKATRRADVHVTCFLPDLGRSVRHQLRLGPPIQSRAAVEEAVSGPGSDGEMSDLYFRGSYGGEAFLTVPGSKKRRVQARFSEHNPFQSILWQVRDVERYPEISRLANLYGEFKLYTEWTFGRNSKLRESVQVGRTGRRLSESVDDLPLALEAMEHTAAHERLRDFLRELKESYSDYKTPTIFTQIGLELVEVPFATNVPAKRLSDGTLRFLALAAILLNPQPPPLICLEEPELGMHPDMIRLVANMIVDAASRTQLIVSTHSEDLLTALQDGFDVLFAFDWVNDGTSVTRLTQEEYQEYRSDHALGDLWASGELGGVRW